MSFLTNDNPTPVAPPAVAALAALVPATPVSTSPSAASPALARYDAACRAVAEARTVDDVQEIAAHAEAMRAYARQASSSSTPPKSASVPSAGWAS
jgi:hypothetical protein